MTRQYLPLTSPVSLVLLIAILLFLGRGMAQDAVLYTFSGGNDGAMPEAILTAGLVLDKSGNLYGVTPEGGADGYGLVYKLTPQPGGGWAQSIVHTFTGGSDGGGYPVSGLSFDQGGNLYGITGGGSGGRGLVFQLALNKRGGWTENVLYNFKDGAPSGVTLNGTDHIFGTTSDGGNAGAGTVFELVKSGGTWTETALYSFSGNGDGRHPDAGVTLGKNGALYGTTFWDDDNGCDCGTAFQLTRNQNGTWTFTGIHRFTGGREGSNPQAALITDTAGNLYGTTARGGGSSRCAGGCGTVFELSPTQTGAWNETVLYRFQGAADGEFPFAPVILDAAGNVYGTTYGGGSHGDGTVFRLTSGGSGAWSKTVLYGFAGGLNNDGANPYGGLIFDPNGNLYGTTSGGLGYGNVFEVPAIRH
jgi:uncharacterized repeat protein (TIGR03803 family)